MTRRNRRAGAAIAFAVMAALTALAVQGLMRDSRAQDTARGVAMAPGERPRPLAATSRRTSSHIQSTSSPAW
jgi:hypothetical protein